MAIELRACIAGGGWRLVSRHEDAADAATACARYWREHHDDGRVLGMHVRATRRDVVAGGFVETALGDWVLFGPDGDVELAVEVSGEIAA